MIHFSCTTCGTAFRVPGDKAGLRTRCTTCRTPLKVPASGPVDPSSQVENTPDLKSRTPLVPKVERVGSPEVDTALTLACIDDTSELPAVKSPSLAEARLTQVGPVNEDSIFRILEELKTEERAAEPEKVDSSMVDTTVVVVPSHLSPKSPVPTPSKQQAMSAAEAAGSALRRAREARKGR